MVFKQNTRSGDFEGFDLSKTRVAGGDVFRFLVTSATAQSAEIHSSTLLATGVWYHVAAVRGSNFTQLYVNGNLESQTNVAFAQNYGTLPLYFGTSGQSYWDHKLNGSLDEVSLYNRALSSNEVAAIYAAGAAGKCKLVTGPDHHHANRRASGRSWPGIQRDLYGDGGGHGAAELPVASSTARTSPAQPAPASRWPTSNRPTRAATPWW